MMGRIDEGRAEQREFCHVRLSEIETIKACRSPACTGTAGATLSSSYQTSSGVPWGPPVLSHRSPSMLAGVQNPCPVGERDINALLPKRRAELGRKLIQHGLDGRIGEMTEVGVDRFARE